jgi:hypothetical protein
MQPIRIRQFTIRGLLVIVGLAAGVALLVRTGFQAREAGRHSHCLNRLAVIGLALHNYQSTYDMLPQASVSDLRGRPMHSWRYSLVPSMESTTWFDSYDFSKPWNAPGNAKLGAMKIGSYICPTQHPVPPGAYLLSNKTSYVAVTGTGTLFPDGRNGSLTGLSAKELAETIIVVESVNQTIGWTEPRDLDLAAYAANPNNPKLPLPSSLHPSGIGVLMADGSRFAMSAGEVRRRLIEMARRGKQESVHSRKP